jgi:F-type H+-transporting ATPase subunit alpha
MEIGFVKQTREFIANLDGLPSARINDLVENDEGLRGLVSSLSENSVEIWLLDEGEVLPGQTFKSTGRRLTVPLGDFLLGRAINPLGVAIDGKPPFTKLDKPNLSEMDGPAKGISARQFIDRQLITGINVIDSIIPLGKGQRELVMGDARSGKMDFLIDIIVNQKWANVVCIFAAIGKPLSEVRNIIDTLTANKALHYTVVVATASSDPAPLIFITPQTAFTIAEYFQAQGKDVLVVLDDLGNHAKIYREIALLGNRSPGKESYPGDIFYQHSHLLERAGNFNKKSGGGSITALPAIELNLNDFTTFIPTNIMSMTDGHLLFKSSLYSQGTRPAIDTSLSVSRVGQQTQTKLENLLATRVKNILAQASKLESVSRFAFELPFATQLILRQKDICMEILKQSPLTYYPKYIQTILLALPFTNELIDKDKMYIRKNKDLIIKAFMEDADLSVFAQNLVKLQTDTELINELNLNPLMKRLDEILAGKAIKPIAPENLKTQNTNVKTTT